MNYQKTINTIAIRAILDSECDELFTVTDDLLATADTLILNNYFYTDRQGNLDVLICTEDDSLAHDAIPTSLASGGVFKAMQELAYQTMRRDVERAIDESWEIIANDSF